MKMMALVSLCPVCKRLSKLSLLGFWFSPTMEGEGERVSPTGSLVGGSYLLVRFGASAFILRASSS